MIGFQTPTQNALDGFFFMYAISNTNLAGNSFFKTSCILSRVSEDFLSGLSDVNGLEKK